MFKISEIYSNAHNMSDRIKICKSGNEFWIELDGMESPNKYDNIFAYGVNLFVLVKKGKFGAIQYDGNLNELQNLPCEYEALDEYWHNLVFSRKDEIVYYNSSTKFLAYDKLISFNPFITYKYFVVNVDTGKIQTYNSYTYNDSTYYKYFIKESDDRIIFSKINNSDNVNIENANLSVDNTTLETKVDRIENCIYLVIFAIACCFGGICAKGFFDKL